MDRFKLMETYAAVVRAASYTGAAHELGVTRALVSKRIQDLEEALGVRLLNRDTHRVSMTASGADYHESCLALLAELSAVEERLQTRRSAPRGELKILSSKTFAERMLGPAVTDFCLLHPGISIHLTVADREQGIDLMSGGFDMAIRSLAVQDSTLIAKPIANLPRVLVASPAYLGAAGAPRTPADLTERNCLDPSGAAHHRWEFSSPSGRDTVRVSGTLSANSSAVIRHAAVKGLGIARLSAYLVAEHLADGALRRVLGTYAMPERKLYVVYQRDSRRPMRMRLFIDFLSRRMKEEQHDTTPRRRRG
jgi:DNA-binding transcriptional LysR family regulator